MINWEYKVFRDNVHGYIQVPLPLVKHFIDTETFQRLRHIEQTGMRVVFPSARHDRFIHSLGTFHLGAKAFNAFKNNVNRHYSKRENPKRNHYKIYSCEKENEDFWNKCEVLFSIACLLHDCGHAPFSHTLEYIYDIEKVGSSETSELDSSILSLYKSKIFQKDFGRSKGKAHERMSAILVKKEFGKSIKGIINEMFDNFHEGDIEFIARAIIGCKYKDISKESSQIKNCLIELLNSSSIDVDGLDYIIRDSYLSGIDNASIDINRLINSLTIVEISHFNDCKLEINDLDAAILDGQFKGQLNGNIAGNFNAMKFSGSLKGMVCIKGNARIDESFNITDGSASVGGVSYNKEVSMTPNVEKIEFDIKVSTKINISDSSFISTNDFNAMIDTKDSILKLSSVFIKGKLNGSFSGSMLGFFEGKKINIELALAFHKSSLNILHNVISARNYEYLWIYGHHKVAYFSNYLLVETLYKTAEAMQNGDLTIEKDKIIAIMFSMLKENKFKEHIFFRPNDSDIIALFKYYHLTNNKQTNKLLSDMYNEYFSRVYKKSVWKSIAEFNYFFGDLTVQERDRLRIMLGENSIIGHNGLYGQLKGQWKNKFKKLGMDNVVWVDAEVPMKYLRLNNTFVLLKNRAIRLKDTLVYNETFNQGNIKLFYLYYDLGKNIDKNSINNAINYLKECAKT